MFCPFPVSPPQPVLAHNTPRQQGLICERLHEAIHKAFSVCMDSLSLAHSGSAAAPKDELAIGTVRTTRIINKSVIPLPLSSPSFIFQPSEVPSHQQQCVSNLRSIIHLPWIRSQQKKEPQKQNCLYSTTGSVFPIPPLSTPSLTEPPGRHMMCLNVCICESTDRCVYVISQLNNNGLNFPAAESYE